MKRTIGFFCFMVVVGCSAEANRAEESSNDDVYAAISIRNTVYGNAYVDGECRCCHLYGKELKKCLSSLDQEELQKHFVELNARRLKQYLLSLSLLEYKEFLSNWTEEQWQEMVKRLDESSKAVIPATKQELMDLIDEVESYPWLELITKSGGSAVKNSFPAALSFNPFTIGYAVYNTCHEIYNLNKEIDKRKEAQFDKLKNQFYC